MRFRIFFLSILLLSSSTVESAETCRYKLIVVGNALGMLAGQEQLEQDPFFQENDMKPSEASIQYYALSDIVEAKLDEVYEKVKAANTAAVPATNVGLGFNFPNKEYAAEAFYSKEFQSYLGELACALKAGAHKEALQTTTMEKLAAPIMQPKNPIAVGVNTKKFRETLQIVPEVRVDSKRTVITGPYADILRPHRSLTDAEAEVGVVIRKKIPEGVKLTPANVSEYVAGFVATADVANQAHIYLRNFGGVEEGFVAAKANSTFLPVGPYFVPIEFFDLDGKNLMPKILSGLLVKQNPEDKTSVEGWTLRQAGFFEDSEFEFDLAQVVELIQKEKDWSDKDANENGQKLLKHGSLEAGDLILMGSLPGIAFQMDIMTHFMGLFYDGLFKNRGTGVNFFRPHYYRYTENPAFPDGRDYGGPYPINEMNSWWTMKANIVREQYCHNKYYVREGDTVRIEMSDLGTQVHAVKLAPNSEKDVAEGRRFGLSVAEISRDELADSDLCAPFESYAPWAESFAGYAVELGAIWAIERLGMQRWKPSGVGGKIGKGATRLGYVSLLTIGALIWHSSSSWAATDPTGFEMVYTWRQEAQMDLAKQMAPSLGVTAGQMEDFIYGIRGGLTPVEAAEAHFPAAIAAQMVEADRAAKAKNR